MNEPPDTQRPNSLISSTIACNGNWKICSWNESATIQFGYKQAEVIGRSLSDFILSPFTSGDFKTPLEELLFASKQHSSNNVKLYGLATDKDFNTFPVEIIALESAIEDNYVLTIHDLVARQQVCERYLREHDLLRILHDIYQIALQPYLLKEALEKILDYLLSIEQINLLPKAAIFLLDDSSDSISIIAQRGFSPSQKKACCTIAGSTCICNTAAKKGKIQFISSMDENHGNTLEGVRPHGHYAVPIKRNQHVIGVLCLTVKDGEECREDITEMLDRVAELLGGIIENQKMDLQLINLVNDLRVSIVNLREEKKYSESIIQGLHHGLVVTDLNGYIQKSNMVAQNILSPSGKPINRMRLHELIGDKAAEEIIVKQVSIPSARVDHEISISTEADTNIVLSFSTVSREDSKGHKVGLIISFTDISEIKYARREMEKMNRLSTVAEIASAVAHEVRNPLAGIKIMAQSIEEDSSSTGDQNECATRIIKQVDRLNELLSEFFSYARPVVPKKRIFSIIDVLREISPLIHSKLEKNYIEFEEIYQPNLPPIIADPNQMQQVFLNLFLNAIDAIKQHGKILITAEELTKSKLAAAKKQLPGVLQGKKYVQFTFSDNGTGMSPETAEKVFEPFFTTKTTGVGLGMSIVYRTLKENDASIVLKSAEGKGTTFTIYFLTP